MTQRNKLTREETPVPDPLESPFPVMRISNNKVLWDLKQHKIDKQLVSKLNKVLT